MQTLKELLATPEAGAIKVLLAGVIDLAGLEDEIQQGEEVIELSEDAVQQLEAFMDDAVAMQPDLLEQLGAGVLLINIIAQKSGNEKFIAIASKLSQLFETYVGEEGSVGKLVDALGIVLQSKKKAVRRANKLPEDKVER